MQRTTTAAALALAAFAGAAGAQNLLNNASFESDLGFDFQNPTNWNGFFGGPAGTYLEAFNTTGATPRTGDKALVTTIRAGTHPTGWDAFTGHVQIVFGITPGTPYELSVFARTNPLINNGAEFRVEWQNASGSEVGRHNVTIDSLLSADYQQFSFVEVAPDGAARAAIVFAVQSFQNNGQPADTSVAWDDASFSVVPAPGTLAVAASGVLALRRRRR